MKRVFSFLFLLSPFFLFSQGVVFEHTPWQEILQKAKSQGKVIFLDAYTSWCGPCKMMSNQTFPDKAVGEYFNANFVNAKIDMEKGEGPELAQRYKVELYPTLLFIDGDGSVVHRVAGFHGPKEFMDLGKMALAPEKRLNGLETRYAAGERDPDLLYNLLLARGAAYDPNAGQVADEYLKTQTDFSAERNMDIVFQFVTDPFSPGFAYFVKNKKQFAQKYGDAQVGAKMDQVFNDYLSTHPGLSYEEVQKLFLSIDPENGAQKASAYRMTMTRQNGDRAGYAAAAVDHFKKYPSENPDELNETAWTFSKVVEDKDMLKQAVKWAKKAAEKQDVYYVNDTLASLYFKLKKKKKAIKYAKKSIEQARAAGEDFGQTQTLLEEIYKL